MAKTLLDSTGLQLYDALIKGVAGGSLTLSDDGKKLVLKSVNGTVLGETDINGTYATKAEVTSVSTTATNAASAANQKVPLSGSRGTLAGYNTPATTASSITINASSNDDTVVTGAVSITVTNGQTNTSWSKVVSITNASATITLDSSWSWADGEAPTVAENCVLVLYWSGTFGLANLIVGGE